MAFEFVARRWRTPLVWSALGLCLAAGLAGCTTPSSPTGGNGGVTPLPSGNGSPGASTGPTGNPAPTSGTALPIPTNPTAYAQAAVNAWIGHDNARVTQLIQPSVSTFSTMSSSNINRQFTLHGICQGAAGSSYCLFINTVGDELTVKVDNPTADAGQPHGIVPGTTFQPITFPSNNQAYAQEALNAWLAQDGPRLNLLTAPGMATASGDLNSVANNLRANGWTFDHSEGAAGSTYYDWVDPSGNTLGFRFLNAAPTPTGGAASHHRIAEIVYLPHP
jgi:hypothetical protein